MIYDYKKNSYKIWSAYILFTNRVVNIWNSLPNVVVHAESTNVFKIRLDKFWSNQEIIYDFMTRFKEPEVKV